MVRSAKTFKVGDKMEKCDVFWDWTIRILEICFLFDISDRTVSS